MAFPCLPQLTHILFSLRAPPTPSPTTQPHPIPNHTGIVHRGEPTTFPIAPRLPIPAFSAGGTHRAHMSRQHATIYPEKLPAPTANADGTSWEPSVMDIDGWGVGFETATERFVKRKGRGSFLYEKNTLSGHDNILEEKGVMSDSLLWRAEGREGRPRLSDGFAYKHWVEETEGEKTPAVMDEGSVSGVLEGSGVCGEHMDVGSPGKKGSDERRDSMGTSVYLTQGA